MKLDKYIAQLLYRYQCVTVPEFGSFLSEVRSAKFTPNTYTFYPPKKVVSFNGLLKTNDGLLVHHIALSEGIPYADAVVQLQQQVRAWQQQLTSERQLTIEGVGELALNAEGNLVFTADETVNYLAESFGLTSVVSPIIRRSQEVTASEQLVEEVAPVVEVPKVIEVQEEATESESKTVKSIPIWRYASAAAAVVLFAGLSVGDYYYGKMVDKQTLAVEQQVQHEVHERIQQASFVLENPTLEAVTLTVKEQMLNYHIVAGAFKEEFNAEKARVDLSNQGYKSRKLPVNKHGLYPVLYESYKTYEEAQLKLKEIKKVNPEAWLLVQEL